MTAQRACWSLVTIACLLCGLGSAGPDLPDIDALLCSNAASERRSDVRLALQALKSMESIVAQQALGRSFPANVSEQQISDWREANTSVVRLELG
jgi:hypothetical protein